MAVQCKMVLLYFLICYTSTLLTTANSYVLLAANLDDFRSIAKKFVPEKLADQIVELASGSGIKYREPSFNHKYEESAEFSEADSRHDQMDHSYEMTTEPYKPIRVATQKAPSAPRFEMKSAQGLSLDEIVEKVKQRLQTELLNREAKLQAQAKIASVAPMRLTGANEPDPSPVYDYNNPAEVEKKIPQFEEASIEKPRVKPAVYYQGQMIQRKPVIQHLTQNKPIVDRNKNLLLNQNRYVNEQAEPVPINTANKVRYVHQNLAPSKPIIKNQLRIHQSAIQKQSLMQQQIPRQQQSPMQQQRQKLNKLAQKQKILKKKQLVRVTPQTILQTPPTTKQQEETVPDIGIFEAVDMLKSNDSYEDYIMPAKEEVFESDVPEEPPLTVTYPSTINPLNQIVTIIIPGAPTLQENEPMAEEIDPNVAQLAAGGVDYDYDAPETTTEPKAKTESISYEEKETKPDPNATTQAEVLVKGKSTKKSKMGTMIPTREFYKLSSPNYYGKLPTIAEKYNFDEPIPEQDREPENLKPIGNPPASINGKVMLL